MVMCRLLFRRIQANFGGNLQFVASGSAALCPETQLFLRVCLDIYLMSSFGATEVTSCAALQRLDDKSVGNCGAPLPGVEIKLENWEEGGYRVTDQPYPRGEVVVGGPTVADGYLGLNDNSFFKDDKGTQWFRTGDIGVILPTGQLNIIDRKKDLVKLQNGEFVSIAKVEGILRGCPEVENLCVVPHARQLVALVCPAEGVVGPEETKGRTFLPAPADLAGKLAQYCAEKGLSKVEIPTSFGLCLEEWTPESGLMTSALKIRRCPIKNRYLEKIESMLQ
ncbi:ACSL4 [Cordylochernes scorpioides]|uniref:long-chain-fatty-acid--CoA ligase n=1 Tax=Cordylochernes scorpioides TaxID=51811 RepID=A0ABY6KXC1_9ARAC|nr:ACSL4 [Cordylochernes scorpioides]